MGCFSCQCASTCQHCTGRVSDENNYLLNVGKTIKKLLGYSYPNPYKSEDWCDNPAKHLFFWALLFNRRDLAQFFWKYTNDHIGLSTDTSTQRVRI